MVVLPIVDPNWAPILENRAVPRDPVWNAREKLRKVERRIGIVANPEKEHLPIQIVHSADRTLVNVRRKRKWARRDALRLGTGRCKSKRVVASGCLR
jgi:hypothetical protein